jgi:hypothetical protein
MLISYISKLSSGSRSITLFYNYVLGERKEENKRKIYILICMYNIINIIHYN